MALKVSLAALLAAASMLLAATDAAAGAPMVSSPAQAVATIVKCRVTRTGDTRVYGKSDEEIYSLADLDFRIWNDDAHRWVSADRAAHWNGKYFTASAREGVGPGRGLAKTWTFNRRAGTMTYRIQTTRVRYGGSPSAQDVVETSSFDFRCERTVDPGQSNGSDAF
jgi:hypothetical protein